MLLTIVTFIIILSLLVFAHELGHFWTARRFNVKAEEFGFGFPPRIFGIYKGESGKWKKVIGSKKVSDAVDTIYSVNWLPLGGFVKIKGEEGEKRNEPDSFSFQKIWKRIIIVSSGVVMNIILAIVLISIGFMLGLPQVIEDLPAGAKVKDRNIQIIQVLKDSPAEKAGIQIGDIIISINDKQYKTYKELQTFISKQVGKELKYKIKRGQEILEFNITPVVIQEAKKEEQSPQIGIGIIVGEIGIVSYPWHQAIWEGIKTTFYVTGFIIIAILGVIKSLIMGQGVNAEIAGPVGIAVLTGQMARLGFIYILQFAAMLSINLAIINFLPFPALDGGRIVFLLIEKIRGRAVPEKVEALVHNIGFALLMLLIILVTYRDVIKFFK